MSRKKDKETKNHFINGSLITSVCILLSRITGFARDMVLASVFGSGMVSDVFFAAFRMPNMLRKILGDGAMLNVFIPIFKSLYVKNKNNALKFSMLIFWTMSFVTGFFFLVFIWKAEFFVKILTSGFISNPEKFRLTVYASRLLFIFIVFSVISSLFGAVLMCIGKFIYHNATSVVLNITCITSIILLIKLQIDTLKAVCIGILIGGVSQIVFTYYGIRKHNLLPHNLDTNSDVSNAKKLFWQRIFPATLNASIFQVNIFINTLFASYTNGLTSYLYYVDRIGQFPLSLIGNTLGTVLLPIISSAKKNQISEMQRLSFDLGMFFSIPCFLCCTLYSKDIIQIIYERGSFTTNDTMIVAQMLILYIISLPFNVLNKILMSFLFSIGKNRGMMLNAFLTVTINVLINFKLFHTNLKIYSIVISICVSAVVNCCITVCFLIYYKIFYLKFGNIIKIIQFGLISVFAFYTAKMIVISNTILINFFIQMVYAGFMYLLFNIKYIQDTVKYFRN